MPLNSRSRRPSAMVLLALTIAAACTAGADKAFGPTPALDVSTLAGSPLGGPVAAAPLGTGVVISQVYGGGGNSGATIRYDFIELYNGSADDVSLKGMSVQYGSSSGTGPWTVTPLTGTIKSGHYYLVREASGATTTLPFPPADDSGGIAMSATAGKVALVTNATALSGACPISGTVLDVVGFGAANCFEGTAPAPALSNTTATFRNDGGRQDTNDNKADFPAPTRAPAPRNSASDPLPPLDKLIVSIDPSAPSKFAGDVVAFTVSASKAGAPVAVSSTTWSSSNTAVATIDASGIATTLKGGSTIITAAVTTAQGNANASTSLSVSGAATSVAVAPLTWSLKSGQTRTFTATAKDEGGNTVPTKISWSSSNTAVATIDPATGVATGRKVGSATITAKTANDITGTATITVTGGNVSVAGRTDLLPVGFQTQLFLSGTGSDSNGDPVTNDNVYWTSASPDVVSVDAATGIITAKSAGSAVITATAKSDSISSGSATINTSVAATFSGARVGHNTELGTPTDADPSDDVIISRRQYTLSFNASRGVPNWVSWNLDETHLSHTGTSPRCNCFTADPELSARGIRAFDTNDWINGGEYSRGHMSPSADWGAAPGDNAPTFYLSNMIPQNQTANSGAWGDFENYLRTVATGSTEIYIVAGPIFTKNRDNSGVDGFGYLKRTNGSTARIAVPDSMFKVAIVVKDGRSSTGIISPSDVQVLAVKMENSVKSVGSWGGYQTTVDRIERSTGYDLLSALPKDLQCRIEVRDCVPNARLVASALAADEGATLSFDASSSNDADAGDVLSYEWQVDGAPAGTAATLSRTFADNGAYQVRVIVADPLGAADTATAIVNIANVAPRVSSFDGATILQGETYSASGSFADPGADSWQAAVDYGDGSGRSPLALAGNTFDLEHRYTSAGSFAVAVTITDDDNGAGSSTARVTVQTPLQGIENLLDAVAALGGGNTKAVANRDGLNKGQLNSLQVKLENAARQLEAGEPTVATEMLGAFLNELDAMTRTGRVSSSAAQPIVDYTGRVISSIGG